MTLLPGNFGGAMGLGGIDSVKELLSNLLDAMGPPAPAIAATGSNGSAPSFVPIVGARLGLDERSPSESPQTSSSTGSLSCAKCDDRLVSFGFPSRCLDCGGGGGGGSGGGGGFGPRLEPHCDSHGEPMRYFCETCRRLVCQECTLFEHKEHSCVPARDAAEARRAKLRETLEQGRAGTQYIKQRIDRAVAVSRDVEKDAAQIAVKIRKAMRHFADAIAERERQLLERLGEVRAVRLDELSDQMSRLRDALNGLVQTNDRLARALELDGLELLATDGVAEATIEVFADVYKSVQPKEEGLFFVSPDFDLVVELKKQGNVATSPCDAALAVSRNRSALGRGHGQTQSQPCRAVVARPLAAPARKVPGRCVPGGLRPVFAKSFENASSDAPLVSFAVDGHEDGQVSRPWGFCVDQRGNIVVADRRNNRVQIFSPEGAFLRKFGSKGSGEGEFDLPAGIATDPRGRIVVVDKDNHRVQVFTPVGGFLLAFGSNGKNCGQFKYPWDVAVNSEGQIVVTDSRNYRIQMFSPEGAFVTMLSFDGSNHCRALKGITTPRGVCFTPAGDVIVSDFENHRLLLVDSTLAYIVGAKGHEGLEPGEFCRPSGVICDDEGKIIVADSKNQRVIAFSPRLDHLWTLEVKGSRPEDNDRPTDVGLTPRGDLVIVVEGLPDAKDNPPPGKTFIQIFKGDP